MKRQILVLAVAMASLSPASLRANIVYEVIDLGTLGGEESRAYSINDAGQIVGWATDSQDQGCATLFDSTGAGNNLALGAGSAHSINDAGQIVGHAGNSHATLFDSTGAGNNLDLGTFGGDRSGALSINEAGQIVGSAEFIPGFRRSSATLFDSTGPLCVTELTSKLGISMAATSHHLRLLRGAGIVKGLKHGLFVYYDLNKKKLAELDKAVGELFKLRGK